MLALDHNIGPDSIRERVLVFQHMNLIGSTPVQAHRANFFVGETVVDAGLTKDMRARS